jgi:DNA helicase-2/ATP-dependent DNA helicase PcrA
VISVDSGRPARAIFDAAALQQLLGIPYSAEQLTAITAPMQPFVVVAGAGSGKTSVMTARVVWLVATGQVAPAQVLGLTFTNKAAGELAARVRRALQLLAPNQSREEIGGEPTISTYHSFAGRLLTEHGLRIGVEPGSRLLSGPARHQLAQRVLTQTRVDLSGLDATLTHLVGQLLALDGELAEHCRTPAELRAFDEALIANIERVVKPVADVRKAMVVSRQRIALSAVVEEFRSAKASRDLVDFADQMRFAATLSADFPAVATALREQFAVVLLDEYQDTSVTQRVLLTGLFGGGHPVTAVGDPLQAIYGWRGASVANIDEFPAHFARADGLPAEVLPLAENRRSGTAILDCANALSAPLRVLHPQVQPLVSPDDTIPAGRIRIALLPTYELELRWMGDRIAEQLGAGTPPGDIAVLCRASADFPAILRELGYRGVPVEVVGVDGMLAVPEVADVVAILEVLHDPTANPALLRLLTGPRWRIGPRDLALLGRRAAHLAGGRGPSTQAPDLEASLDAAVAGTDHSEVISLLDALDDPGDGGYDPVALQRFSSLSDELRSLRRQVGEPLPDLVHRVTTATGLDVELASSPLAQARSAVDSLAAFAALVSAFVDADGRNSLGAFVSWLEVARRYDAVPELERPLTPGAVQLMTVHRSKGLEWPVVVLPSWTAGVFPSSKARSRWHANAAELPYPLRGDRHALPVMGEWSTKGLAAFADDCKAQAEHEERRLAYVAVTRAKRLVLISGSWWGPTQVRHRGPSSYALAVQQLCLAGSEQMAEWAPAPEASDMNPAGAAGTEVSWPVVADPVAREVRVAAAAAVRSAIAAGVSRESTSAENTLGMLDDLAEEARELIAGWDADLGLLLDEVAVHSQPRKVMLPTSMSVSQVQRLAADEESFVRALIRPLPLAPARAAQRGTRFHALVEQHYEDRHRGIRPLLSPDDLPGAADDDLGSDEDLAAMVESFLAGPYAERAPLGIEVPFTLSLGGRVVSGRIDAVFAAAPPNGNPVLPPRFEVVDWKTSRSHTADPLQLGIYRLAYAELAGVPLDRVDAILYYVRDGAVVRLTDLPDRDELVALLS